jgi:hypothetical protein
MLKLHTQQSNKVSARYINMEQKLACSTGSINAAFTDRFNLFIELVIKNGIKQKHIPVFCMVEASVREI